MAYFPAKLRWLYLFLALAALGSIRPAFGAGNRILGKIVLRAENRAAKTSGVWIDGQYVGYLGELKGSSRLYLLPGGHEIVVRQDGYLDFRSGITVEPGSTLVVPVLMQKNPRSVYSSDPAQLKLQVDPARAAVFVDGQFVGYAGEFGRGMLLSPGRHRIKIDVPAYRPFTATVDLLPHQTAVLKTKLVAGSIDQADPLIHSASR